MQVNKGILKTVAALLILGAIFYGLFRFIHDADLAMPALLQPSSGKRLVMSMEGFRFIQVEDGRVMWRLHARNADLYESKEAQLKDIEIAFIGQDRREVTLLGETGTLDTVSGDASIHRGSREVRIVTTDGYLLTTDSLVWRAGERVVLVPGLFKLLGRELYLEGRRLSANTDMRKLEVHENVKAVLQE